MGVPALPGALHPPPRGCPRELSSTLSPHTRLAPPGTPVLTGSPSTSGLGPHCSGTPLLSRTPPSPEFQHLPGPQHCLDPITGAGIPLQIWISAPAPGQPRTPKSAGSQHLPGPNHHQDPISTWIPTRVWDPPPTRTPPRQTDHTTTRRGFFFSSLFFFPLFFSFFFLHKTGHLFKCSPAQVH